jgi:uncharacterized protein YacL
MNLFNVKFIVILMALVPLMIVMGILKIWVVFITACVLLALVVLYNAMWFVTDIINKLLFHTVQDINSNLKQINSIKKIPNNYYILLDTNILYDSRIFDLMTDPIFKQRFCITRFVFEELLSIAKGGDSESTKQRAKNVITNLQMLLDHSDINVIDISRDNSMDVDIQMINLAKQFNAIIFTNDVNMRSKAVSSGVQTSSLIDLSESLAEPYGIDEVYKIEIVKRGKYKNKNEGIGYFMDGSMVVVNNAGDKIGESVIVKINNMVKNNAGRVYWASLE